MTRTRIHRREFAATAGLSLVAPRLTALEYRRAARPNILFVMTDQQHIDTIAAGGCPYVATPAMDRLVRTGSRFAFSLLGVLTWMDQDRTRSTMGILPPS